MGNMKIDGTGTNEHYTKKQNLSKRARKGDLETIKQKMSLL